MSTLLNQMKLLPKHITLLTIILAAPLVASSVPDRPKNSSVLYQNRMNVIEDLELFRFENTEAVHFDTEYFKEGDLKRGNGSLRLENGGAVYPVLDRSQLEPGRLYVASFWGSSTELGLATFQRLVNGKQTPWLAVFNPSEYKIENTPEEAFQLGLQAVVAPSGPDDQVEFKLFTSHGPGYSHVDDLRIFEAWPNYLANGGFESGSMDPWSVESGIAECSDDPAMTGQGGLALSPDAIVAQQVALYPDTLYGVSFQIMGRAGDSLELVIRGLNGPGSEVRMKETLKSDSAWGGGDFIVEAKAVSDEVTVELASRGNTQVVYVDNIEVYPRGPNLFKNGGLEQGHLHNWSHSWGDPGSIILDTENPRTGRYCLRLGYNPKNNNRGGVRCWVEGLKPKTVYMATAWVQGKGAQFGTDRLGLGYQLHAEGGSNNIGRYGKVYVPFVTKPGQTRACLLLFRHYWDKQDIYLDDLEVFELPAAPKLN